MCKYQKTTCYRSKFSGVAALLLLLSATISAGSRRDVDDRYGDLPLSFEANQGQTDSRVRFLSQGNAYSLFLTESEAVLALHAHGKREVLEMKLSGAARGIRLTGVDQLAGKANYFIGRDSANWHSNIPTYRKVRYAGVYPGVDLVFYGNPRQLEYDFVIAPGADPGRIMLRFSGTRKLRLDQQGNLLVSLEGDDIVFHKPMIYQEFGKSRRPVSGEFALLAKTEIGFTLGTYDRSRPVVIDPTLAYSTYLGGDGYHIPAGPDCCGDSASGVAVDSTGNAYVTGTTGSSNFPVSHDAFQPSNRDADGQGNAFVTKLNPEGTEVVYSTYLGGTGDYWYHDSGKAIAVDGSGHAYVTGFTGSKDFPVTKGAFQPSHTVAVRNAFVSKLSPDGSKLIYSTYLGGSGFNTGRSFDGDIGTGIAVDKSGDSYVTGSTFSKDFPVTKNAFQRVNKAAAINSSNIFATKLNPQGTELVYSTYVGGSGVHQNCCSYFAGADYGTGIALDSEGYAYLTGCSYSKDFPVTASAFQKTNRAHSSINGTGAYDTNAFITKLNLAGTALVYSTYLGGSGGEFYGDQANGIAVGRSGAAFVTGQAISADFPVTKGAFQLANRDSVNLTPNAFVTKINPAGNGLVYSTFLGGSGGYRSPGDSASGIAVNGSGEAYVVGTTYSSDFPITPDAFQKHNHQSANPGADYYSGNVFFVKFNPAGSALLYSSYVGGSGDPSGKGGDVGSAIAIGGAGNAFLTGYTRSHDFPVTKDAFQRVNNAYKAGNRTTTNAFVVKLNVGGIE